MAEIQPDVEIVNVPEVEGTGSVTARANTGIEDESEDFRIRAQFDFFKDGESFGSQEFDGLLQDEVIRSTASTNFDVGDASIRVRLRVDLYNVGGFDKNTGTIEGEFDGEDEDEETITVQERTFTAGGEETTTPGISGSFQDALDFEITNITGSDTGPVPNGSIEFEYPNPAIGVDTGGNFVTHDIIGGATVRQRIGDQPLEISIGGVATEDTVAELELLRNALAVTLLSDRFSQNSVRVHVVSVSTDPLSDGGAADLRTGEFLYQFSLECVEILDTGEIEG